jgi:hypothetical protein
MQRLADAAYYGWVRTPEEIRVFKQDLARVADEMGFTNAERNLRRNLESWIPL